MIHTFSSIKRDEVRTSLNPRLAFNAVTNRVFPLKASMNQLQDFCDNYLNFVDEEKRNRPTHYFKPAVPWVYCQVVNYGQCATATKSLGWISQHEVVFLVPLAWYVIEKGELRFKDWAMVCPFAFVDNDISVTTGREIYGWVKVRAWLDRLDPNWADDPSKPGQVLDMRAELFPRAYAGEKLEQHSLLQITQAPPPSVFRDPFAKDALFGPGWSVAEAMRTSVGFVRDLFEVAIGFPMHGYDPRSVPTTVDMFARSALNWTRLLPSWQPDRDTVREVQSRAHARGRNLYFNQITLKQFRDAAEPSYACYQALVNSRIAVDHYYKGGLLGPANVAFGDITGGFRLLLHDYPEQQIQSTLGLEVEDWLQAADNHRVAVLTPQLPFWVTYDLRYDNGDTLCWRTKTSDWHCDPCPEKVRKYGRANEFNAAQGLAIQEQFGPFVYPDVTVRVFPLEADKDVLQRYCDENFNKQGDPPLPGELPTIGDNYFEPWGCYVYMCVIVHGPESIPWSQGNNIGPTAREQVIFYLPVKWYRRTVPGGASLSPIKDNSRSLTIFKLAVLTPFVFGEGRQVISEREVNGLPSRYSELAGGPDVWLNTFRGKERSVLAELTSLLITALDVGQPARDETILEVVSVPKPVLDELESETTTLLALFLAAMGWVHCVLCHIAYWIRRILMRLLPFLFKFCRPRFLRYIAAWPFNYVSLKRVMSTSHEAGKKVTQMFAYQALVLVEKTIDRLFATSWVDKKDWGIQRFVDCLDKNIRIDIRYHEGLDIVGTLGLKNGIDVSRPGSAPVLEFRPRSPFAVRLRATERRGCNVQTKIKGDPWGGDLLADPSAAGQFNPKLPTGGDLNDLLTFANQKGPQRTIRRYVRRYGRGCGCWNLHP
jgi:hypothetical protein